MSNTNDLPTTVGSKSGVFGSGCDSCGRGILRAVVFAPVILILGAFAALAMFPDLADYGYPLIGNPSHTGFTGARPCSLAIGSSSCSAQATLPGSCSFPSNQTPLNSIETGGCCPVSRAGQISTKTTVESTPAADEGADDFQTKAAIFNKTPADATLPLNLVESEVSSN